MQVTCRRVTTWNPGSIWKYFFSTMAYRKTVLYHNELHPIFYRRIKVYIKIIRNERELLNTYEPSCHHNFTKCSREKHNKPGQAWFPWKNPTSHAYYRAHIFGNAGLHTSHTDDELWQVNSCRKRSLGDPRPNLATYGDLSRAVLSEEILDHGSWISSKAQALVTIWPIFSKWNIQTETELEDGTW